MTPLGIEPAAFQSVARNPYILQAVTKTREPEKLT